LGFSMVLLFCSFALAYAIGDHLDSYPLGFLVVGILSMQPDFYFW
jgi:hypothetical protein